MDAYLDREAGVRTGTVVRFGCFHSTTTPTMMLIFWSLFLSPLPSSLCSGVKQVKVERLTYSEPTVAGLTQLKLLLVNCSVERNNTRGLGLL